MAFGGEMSTCWVEMGGVFWGLELWVDWVVRVRKLRCGLVGGLVWSSGMGGRRRGAARGFRDLLWAASRRGLNVRFWAGSRMAGLWTENWVS